jgi:phosphatidate cytidylyltransferase
MLKTRVYTAIVLLILIACVLFALPAVAGRITLIAVLAIGAWEWTAFAGFSAPIARAGYVLATLLLAYMTEQGLRTSGVVPLMLVAVAWWAVATVRILLVSERVSVGMTLVAGWLTMLPAIAAVAHLYSGSGLLGRATGNRFFLLLLALVAAADIGAYFVGRRFGRTKLAPEVSPGKTWEGVLGGALVVSVLAFVMARVFVLPPLGFVAVAACVFVASVVGDLTESLFKRGAGLKDSGVILPGHGGILDRVDSLTAAAPVFVLGLHWLRVLT